MKEKLDRIENKMDFIEQEIEIRIESMKAGIEKSSNKLFEILNTSSQAVNETNDLKRKR